MIRFTGGLIGVAALVAAWLWLAPPNLGGATSYVVLYGSSMEPGFRAGDLVLARPVDGGDLRVGDVVAYRHPHLGKTVLHRIVARDGDRLQLKGDANDYVDLPRPSDVQVLGREWLRVPRVGAALEWVRQPLHASLAVLVLVLLLAGGGGAHAARGRLGRAGDAAATSRPEADAQGRRALRATAALAAVVLAALAVGAVAYTRPADERVPWPGRWTQSVRLSYGADSRPSVVYPSGRVTTGDALYGRLVPRVRLRADYRLRTPDGAGVSVRGSGALLARVKGDNGWQTTIELAPSRPLAAPSAAVEGTLDLRRLVADVRRVEALTGARATSYTVTVTAPLRLSGAVGEDAVDTRFAPSFAFRLIEDRLEAVPPDAGAETAPAAAWVRSEEGTGTRLVPARVRLGAAASAVGDVRRLAVLLALLALAGVPLAVLYVLVGGRRGDDASERLAPWLVDVVAMPSVREVRDVAEPETLARLAERFETVVLRVTLPAGRLFGVEAHGVLYRYRDGVVDEWPQPGVRAVDDAPTTVVEFVRPRVVTPLRERVGP